MLFHVHKSVCNFAEILSQKSTLNIGMDAVVDKYENVHAYNQKTKTCIQNESNHINYVENGVIKHRPVKIQP